MIITAILTTIGLASGLSFWESLGIAVVGSFVADIIITIIIVLLQGVLNKW